MRPIKRVQKLRMSKGTIPQTARRLSTGPGCVGAIALPTGFRGLSALRDHTIVEELRELAVDVNGLVVPARWVEKTLARHSFNLVVSNDDDTYKVSLVGSATAVIFEGRYYLLCTQHQLVGVDPQKVSMLKDDGSVLVTSSGYSAYSPSKETDAYDIAAFDFTDAVTAHPDLKPRFFPLTTSPPDTLSVNVLAVLVTGYPSESQQYELAERNHLGLSRMNVVCTADGQPSDAALIRLRAREPVAIDVDGMSGGSAFVVQINGGVPTAYFGGIIVRGGGAFFYALKSGFVVAFLRGIAR